MFVQNSKALQIFISFLVISYHCAEMFTVKTEFVFFLSTLSLCVSLPFPLCIPLPPYCHLFYVHCLSSAGWPHPGVVYSQVVGQHRRCGSRHQCSLLWSSVQLTSAIYGKPLQRNHSMCFVLCFFFFYLAYVFILLDVSRLIFSVCKQEMMKQIKSEILLLFVPSVFINL